jgi:hypothetical protein
MKDDEVLGIGLLLMPLMMNKLFPAKCHECCTCPKDSDPPTKPLPDTCDAIYSAIPEHDWWEEWMSNPENPNFPFHYEVIYRTFSLDTGVKKCFPSLTSCEALFAAAIAYARDNQLLNQAAFETYKNDHNATKIEKVWQLLHVEDDTLRNMLIDWYAVCLGDECFEQNVTLFKDAPAWVIRKEKDSLEFTIHWHASRLPGATKCLVQSATPCQFILAEIYENLLNDSSEAAASYILLYEDTQSEQDLWDFLSDHWTEFEPSVTALYMNAFSQECPTVHNQCAVDMNELRTAIYELQDPNTHELWMRQNMLTEPFDAVYAYAQTNYAEFSPVIKDTLDSVLFSCGSKE